MPKPSSSRGDAVTAVALIAIALGSVPVGAAPGNSRDRGVSASPKVLMIGDSLTVGPFGDRMESWLVRSFGASHASIYASCGSSPEHWLAAEKVFVTPCGYRETVNGKRQLEKHRNGRKPRRTSTPKIESLLARHRPDIVLVQLGTNHFDNLAREGRSAIPGLIRHYASFATALDSARPSVPVVVWITPPDSSKFPKWVQQEIEQIITDTCKRHRFGILYSRRFTRYKPGTTGSDGVHYGDAAAHAWATEVAGKLQAGFRKRGILRQN